MCRKSNRIGTNLYKGANCVLSLQTITTPKSTRVPTSETLTPSKTSIHLHVSFALFIGCDSNSHFYHCCPDTYNFYYIKEEAISLIDCFTPYHERELNAVDHKLQASSLVPLPFSKTHSSDLSVVIHAEKNTKPFVMHVSDDDDDDVVNSGRFACDEIYLSDDVDSDSDSSTEAQCSLMDKGGLIEGALIELSHEHQLSVAEEIRSRISAFGTDFTNEKEKLTNAISRAEKSKEARRELDRKRDLQYQRIIAEALDNHLTDVQRHHEYKSQIEEKKIRDDAAIEESKRKQKALQEEKVRQEKMKSEEAKRQAEKKREEEMKAKAKALEDEKRAAKEAAMLSMAESQRKAAEALTASNELNKPSSGNVVKGAESGLKMEEKRVQMYKQVIGKDLVSEMDSNKEYRSHGMQMARRIKTITGTKENVRTKADELVKLMNSTFPQSINIGIFADKIVSQSTNASSNSVLYGYGHVIVMVTSKIPHAMEILLAKLNKVCIFTVPKYLSYSEGAFESREAYYKAIGYEEEEDGKLESTDTYVGRLTQHMKLYAALIQTEVDGFRNLHGIEEGWKWLARFLNALPANIYTGVALQAFIELAGFGMYKRYKNQFKKLLNIISQDFLKALKEREDPKVTKVVISLENYIQSKEFLKEPEGWRLQDSLLSHGFVPNESDDQQQYYNNNNNNNSSGGYGYKGYQQQYNYNNSPNRYVYQR
ncbi:unnamed protein product [Lactuca saligna]|uniref:mRNA export factor GLE1 n=1 Tax=Lactuca saligna TaxID=75948 RepID=A0AA35ZXE3_LACSI|nr:unnamed protein product [Lactuca saligna]